LNRIDISLLWDMDGTIFDTWSCHFSTWHDTLQRYGYELDRTIFEANFGRNTSVILPLFLGFKPDVNLAQRIIEEKEALFRQVASQEAALIPGVVNWLKRAKALNIPQAIASSASLENIRMMTASFDLFPYFDAVIPGDDQPAKPNPTIFLKTAEILHQSPQCCLVIEDSVAGVEAAKNAGMLCIAVTTTFPHSELSSADLVLPDFTMPLETALREINIL